LAQAGQKLHQGLFLAITDRELVAGLRAARTRPDDLIQIVHYAYNFPFPWPLLYDFDLPENIAGAPLPDVCKGFRRQKQGRPYSCRECLKECLHPDKRESVCAFGFWGMRHQVEQLLLDGTEHDEPPELKPMAEGAVGVLIGYPTHYLSAIPGDLTTRLGAKWVKTFSRGRGIGR
jgi:hypothetical protein